MSCRETRFPRSSPTGRRLIWASVIPASGRVSLSNSGAETSGAYEGNSSGFLDVDVFMPPRARVVMSAMVVGYPPIDDERSSVWDERPHRVAVYAGPRVGASGSQPFQFTVR